MTSFASPTVERAGVPLRPRPSRFPGRVLSGAVSGYVLTPAGVAEPCPTIMHIGGYDGTAEELYASAPPALARGYAFVAIDGPGQGATLYEQRMPMRPDWENVVPAMFDAVAALPEVDPGRVVLVGRSFGGGLAPRGAAGEQRLAAMIVDPGQFDLGSGGCGAARPDDGPRARPDRRRAVRLAPRSPGGGGSADPENDHTRGHDRPRVLRGNAALHQRRDDRAGDLPLAS